MVSWMVGTDTTTEFTSTASFFPMLWEVTSAIRSEPAFVSQTERTSPVPAIVLAASTRAMSSLESSGWEWRYTVSAWPYTGAATSCGPGARSARRSSIETGTRCQSGAALLGPPAQAQVEAARRSTEREEREEREERDG